MCYSNAHLVVCVCPHVGAPAACTYDPQSQGAAAACRRRAPVLPGACARGLRAAAAARPCSRGSCRRRRRRRHQQVSAVVCGRRYVFIVRLHADASRVQLMVHARMGAGATGMCVCVCVVQLAVQSQSLAPGYIRCCWEAYAACATCHPPAALHALPLLQCCLIRCRWASGGQRPQRPQRPRLCAAAAASCCCCCWWHRAGRLGVYGTAGGVVRPGQPGGGGGEQGLPALPAAARRPCGGSGGGGGPAATTRCGHDGKERRGREGCCCCCCCCWGLGTFRGFWEVPWGLPGACCLGPAGRSGVQCLVRIFLA